MSGSRNAFSNRRRITLGQRPHHGLWVSGNGRLISRRPDVRDNRGLHQNGHASIVAQGSVAWGPGLRPQREPDQVEQEGPAASDPVARRPRAAAPMNIPRNDEASSSFSVASLRSYWVLSVVLMVLDRK